MLDSIFHPQIFSLLLKCLDLNSFYKNSKKKKKKKKKKKRKKNARHSVFQLFHVIFSSPKPKAPGELIV